MGCCSVSTLLSSEHRHGPYMKAQSSHVRRRLNPLSVIDQTTGFFSRSEGRFECANPREVSNIVRSRSRAAHTVVAAVASHILRRSCISHGLRSSRRYILQIAWCIVDLHTP